MVNGVKCLRQIKEHTNRKFIIFKCVFYSFYKVKSSVSGVMSSPKTVLRVKEDFVADQEGEDFVIYESFNNFGES